MYREVENLKGWLADRVNTLKSIKWREALQSQFKRVQRSRGDLTAEFIAHAREYAQDLVPERGPEKDMGYDR